MGYADYTTPTGAGEMLIRVADAAGTADVIAPNRVRFFVRSGYSATYIGSPGIPAWIYYNGAEVSLNNIANYSGTGWMLLGEIHVTYTQDIRFRIAHTGTSGMGGPTEFWLKVNRGTIPPAPSPIGIDNVKHQQFRYRFSGNGDGGAAIIEWQIGYGYDPNNVQYTAPSSGTIDVGTFIPGATIYIWSRGRNSVGWGPWSSRSQVTLKRAGRVKYNGAWAHAIPYVKDGKVPGVSDGTWKPAEPYIKKGKVPGVSDGTWTLVEYAA